MNDPVYQRLLDASWRRDLTPDEQAHLEAIFAARPEARAAWQDEAALSGLLRRLPDAPLSSNFTSQVLRAAEAEATRLDHRRTRGGWREGWLRSLWPKMAWAAVALVLAGGTVQQYRHLSRARLARDLVKMSAVAALPSLEVLQDFESIQRLSHVPAVSDEDLLTALQ